MIRRLKGRMDEGRTGGDRERRKVRNASRNEMAVGEKNAKRQNETRENE